MSPAADPQPPGDAAPDPAREEFEQPEAPESAGLRVLPFVMLVGPFTAFLIIGAVVLVYGWTRGGLDAATAQERAERELFAIRATPAAQVTLLETAVDQPPTEWGAGVVWAVRDLAERATLALPAGTDVGAWPSETRGELAELLARFAAELEAGRVRVPGLYNRSE